MTNGVFRKTLTIIHAFTSANQPDEERLKELDMCSLEKRRERGEMITLFTYLKGCSAEEEHDPSSIIPESRTRTEGLKPQEASFRLSFEPSS